MPTKDNLLKSYPKSSDRASMYISESPKIVDGFEDITDDIRRGKAMLYDKEQLSPSRYFQDRNGRVYIMNTWAKNPDIGDMDELFADDIKAMLPKRDYIGGKPMEARIEAARRIPGFTGKVYERATAYGIDPNLLLHRLIREGYIDNRIREYNGKLVPDSDNRNFIYTDEQPDYWKNRWNETNINGYEELGLDYTGSELLDGKYNLLDPSVTWQSVDWTDDEPGYQRSGIGMAGDLNAMIEGTAAAMKYRHDLAKERYNPEGNDEWYYTNAMFNMGQNNDRLDDIEYVRKQYQYPDYYNTYNLNTKSVGGLLERIVNVYGNDTQSIHQAIRGIKYNELKSGGKIYIKPSHRGRFTSLLKRTGKSASWFKAHGTPAQKKMATFALNARHWKHEDGGPIQRAISSNKADVVLAAIRKMKSDVTP